MKKNKLPQIEIKKTNKGNALFIKENIDSGIIICPVDGQTIKEEERTEQDEEYCINDPLKPGLLIRPNDKSVWHIANHSCNPNSILDRNIISVRPIRAGEEITVFYSWHNYRASLIKCLCNSKYCYGTIGPRFNYTNKDKGYTFTADFNQLKEYIQFLYIDGVVEEICKLQLEYNISNDIFYEILKDNYKSLKSLCQRRLNIVKSSKYLN